MLCFCVLLCEYEYVSFRGFPEPRFVGNERNVVSLQINMQGYDIIITRFRNMTEDIFDKDALLSLDELMTTARNIVITCHLSPDGDAMGSSLGLRRALWNMGKKARVITPDTPPKYLQFLPGAEDIVIFSRSEAFATKSLAEADLIFCLDYNEPKRIDRVAQAMLDSQAPKVMIDHHLHPSDFPEVVISHPEQSSTSLLVYRVLNALGRADSIDATVAECLYTGMMTDTGNFSYNSNDAAIYLAVADLISRGIDKDAIYRQVYYSDSLNRLRLNAYAMLNNLEVFPEHHAAIITLSRKELNEFQYQKGDTENLVNRPLTIPEITYSLFLREESNYVKVSTRSKGDFPVNLMCQEHFHGGGHLNAAGGEFYGTMEECLNEAKRAMELFDKYLSK